ncbi:MAG: substrate-binding domain-containing protein [Alphaproteobacteria bacterium]|nr:substrate-binding domain-containing protein [Alphaproteobacteria bacterium]
MNKIFLAALLFVSLLTLATPTKAEQGSIAALISDTSNPYWKTLENGLRDTAKTLGIQIDISAIQSASDAEGQLNHCESALLKNPKAIIFAAVDAVNLGSCLRKADAKGIALIDIDGNVDQQRAEKMGVHVAFSVASNNVQLGKKAASYLTGQKGKILVIEGMSGSQPGILRVKGFKDNLDKGLTIVASQGADWDRLKAADIVSRIVTQHPDLSFIFAANDTMALGAVEALRAANINTVKVVGIDGSTDAIKAIKEGRLTASIAQLPYLMAKEALEKASQYIKDRKPLSFEQYVPILTLDKAVFEKNNEALLQYVR